MAPYFAISSVKLCILKQLLPGQITIYFTKFTHGAFI